MGAPLCFSVLTIRWLASSHYLYKVVATVVQRRPDARDSQVSAVKLQTLAGYSAALHRQFLRKRTLPLFRQFASVGQLQAADTWARRGFPMRPFPLRGNLLSCSRGFYKLFADGAVSDSVLQ